MKRARKIKGEGWDVFDTDGSEDGSRQICMMDDPGHLEMFEGYEGRVACAFRGDGEAIVYVIAQAKKGDEACIDALWEVLDQDSLVNRILWCQAMGWNGKDDAAFPQ